jgi:hypothetical protein
MAEFQGEKLPKGQWATEYVRWLEQQVASLRCSNTTLRKQLEAQRREESRRLRDAHDYMEYPDDDYDR